MEVYSMSRSYKHTPYAGQQKLKWAKRQANKLVRSKLKRWNIQDNVSPSWYKKVSESWNICDYYTITSWNEHILYRKELLNRGIKPWGMVFIDDEPDWEKERNIYEKWYRRK